MEGSSVELIVQEAFTHLSRCNARACLLVTYQQSSHWIGKFCLKASTSLHIPNYDVTCSALKSWMNTSIDRRIRVSELVYTSTITIHYSLGKWYSLGNHFTVMSIHNLANRTRKYSQFTEGVRIRFCELQYGTLELVNYVTGRGAQ